MESYNIQWAGICQVVISFMLQNLYWQSVTNTMESYSIQWAGICQVVISVISVGCNVLVQPTDNMHAIYQVPLVKYLLRMSK
jgi:hypothetical protein